MAPAFREAAATRKRRGEEGWRAYLSADPICWGWPVPEGLENWAPPQDSTLSEHLSASALAMVMGNPESRADAILSWWQDGRCAICGHRYELVEDHDHDTGLVRGYLCRRCNAQEGIHRYGDNLFARYRRRHPTSLLGLRIRYWDPFANDYAPCRKPAATDKWTDAASVDIGL